MNPIIRNQIFNFKSSKSSWTKLIRNTDIVEAGNYQAADVSGDNYAINDTGRWFLNKNNLSRIRQSGNITQFKIYINVISGVDTVYFQVWRYNAGTSRFDLVGEEEIKARLTATSVNTITLNTPIAVLEGDYVGIGGISSSPSSKFVSLKAKNVTTANSIRYKDLAKPATDYNFNAATGDTYNIPIKVYMQSPLVALIGDSIIAGHPAHYSFVENSLTSSLLNQVGAQLALINSKYIYQNMGIGNTTSTQISARFVADVVALKPKMAIINGGVNDIYGGLISKVTFLSNYTSMLNACIAASIVPVVCKILPWTEGTNEQMIIRDEWMVDLQALVATYDGAVWVDFDVAMGKNRVGGSEDNLWDLKTNPDYDEDTVHPTLLGYAKMAETINNAIIAAKYKLA